MTRAVWITDIHLDFLDGEAAGRFLTSLADAAPDVLLVGGDTSTAPRIVDDLRRIGRTVGVPVCFVLGNHDFYHGSIAAVRRDVAALCEGSRSLHWLNRTVVFEVTPDAAVVGHDGWGDAREGEYRTSPVDLSDFYLIEELRGLGRDERAGVLRALGDEAAAHLREVLPAALAAYRRVVVLTHVPPFREAAWYGGRVCDDDWLPYFCCRAAGDAIRDAVAGCDGREVTVLCGHTHGEGEVEIAPGVTVITGGARYRDPRIQRILELD